MKLYKIIYEIFESDAQRLDENPSEIHEIDREIRLVDEEGLSTFISWCPEPVQYGVGVSNVSFFDQPSPVVRDMSNSEFWKGMVGKDIAFKFVDNHHQVLEVGSSEKTIFCWTSAFEESGKDTLFISTQRPRPH